MVSLGMEWVEDGKKDKMGVLVTIEFVCAERDRNRNARQHRNYLYM